MLCGGHPGQSQLWCHMEDIILGGLVQWWRKTIGWKKKQLRTMSEKIFQKKRV